MDEKNDATRQGSTVEVSDLKEHNLQGSELLVNVDLMASAYDGENFEHEETTWQAVKRHPKACFWAFIMCFTIVMESFDMFLNGNFVAQEAFKRRYGVPTDKGPEILTKWQSALFQSGQCGAFIGVFLAGPITNRLGYRWTTILGLVAMNATIFISFFADSLEVLTVGQFFEGIPWGLFIANSPAYASEVVPLALRGACTATLQMSWSIGGILVAAVCYKFQYRQDQWAWKAPLALQWMFPTPLIAIIWFAPESPWWLIRRGRRDEAKRSIKRLSPKNSQGREDESLAMMERTVEIERKIGGDPTLLDLFKGTDLRRTLIVCLAYASQNFAGNLIANQATFFFEQAGMKGAWPFKLNMINSCLQFVANIISLPLTAYFGRRQIFLYGAATNFCFLIILGVLGSIEQTQACYYAQASMGVIISFVFAGTLGPIAYTIIAETSAVRLRALSTGVGRAAYYVAEIPMIFLASWLLNPTGGNLGSQCGFVWGGTAAVCFVVAFFGLPELKHRSYREADILFNRRISARKFKSTIIDVKDNE